MIQRITRTAPDFGRVRFVWDGWRAKGSSFGDLLHLTGNNPSGILLQFTCDTVLFAVTSPFRDTRIIRAVLENASRSLISAAIRQEAVRSFQVEEEQVVSVGLCADCSKRT